MDNFQTTLMHSALASKDAPLDSTTAEVYCKELIGLVESPKAHIVVKQLFHKIAKGSFVRGEVTAKFMEYMNIRSW